MTSIVRLRRIGLNVRDASRLARFYEQAFGSRYGSRYGAHASADRASLPGSKVRTLTLALGAATLELFEYEVPGRPYPARLMPWDREFQHLALVVPDMTAAMARLGAVAGWSAISLNGPQRLPASSGGVTAFKFRDPEGHPLEFLQFAPDRVPAHWRQAAVDAGTVLGIDHSAISCADVERSIAFYAGHGLTVSMRTLNQGAEQGRLDGVPDPVVDVVALAPREPAPHVELLHYRNAPQVPADEPALSDAAATRLIFETTARTAGGDASRLVRDPDGHVLELIGSQTAQ